MSVKAQPYFNASLFVCKQQVHIFEYVRIRRRDRPLA
jgi:hypothetical protein